MAEKGLVSFWNEFRTLNNARSFLWALFFILPNWTTFCRNSWLFCEAYQHKNSLKGHKKFSNVTKGGEERVDHS